MAFLPGVFSLICEGELNIGSSCIQRTFTDALNLLFLVIFYLFLIARGRTSSSNRRDRVSVVVSICCAVNCIEYISVGLWELIGQDERLSHLKWLIHLVRGLIWISLSFSLLVTKSKWITIISSVWWVTFFLTISAINVEKLVIAQNIQVLDILPWPVNFLLLFCAFRNLSHFTFQQTSDSDVSEPLLSEKAEKRQSKLGEAGSFSKLTFSWINPLLGLGHSKPLNLEDIPTLVSEDESNVAYQKFAEAWDSVVKERSSRNSVLDAVIKVYLKENIFVGICSLLRTLSVVSLPLVLYTLVNYSNLEEQNLFQGLSIVFCLILLKGIESLSQRHCFFAARQSGMRIRSALMVAVYQKQLKLSSLGRRRHSTGEIVNYIAVDAYRMGEFPWWFHSTWSLVLRLFLAIALLFGVVGLGAVIGLIP